MTEKSKEFIYQICKEAGINDNLMKKSAVKENKFRGQ